VSVTGRVRTGFQPQVMEELGIIAEFGYEKTIFLITGPACKNADVAEWGG